MKRLKSIIVFITFICGIFCDGSSVFANQNFNSIARPGIWVNLKTANDGKPGFQFISTHDNTLTLGTYIESNDYGPVYDGSVKVTDIKSLGNCKYRITGFWLATKDHGEKPAYEELTITESTIKYNYANLTFTYISENIEGVKVGLRDYNKKNTAGIATIPYGSSVLHKAPTSLKNKIYRDPYRDGHYKKLFNIKESVNINFCKPKNGSDFYGIRNGKIVFWGIMPEMQQVHQYVEKDILSIHTASFKVHPESIEEFFVWKMDNCYLVLCTHGTREPYYTRWIYSLMQVANIEDMRFY